MARPIWVPLRPQSVASRTNVSAPGSLVVKLYVSWLPSLALAEPVSVTVGPTLAMATVTVSLSDALSESLTVTLTVELAGPSGNEQTKLPAPLVLLKLARPIWVPLRPQSVASRTNVSAPGSLVVKL